MNKVFLTPEDLAKRWCVPTCTLEQWRWTGKGPQFVKIGRRVRYVLEDIESFENQYVMKKSPYQANNLYSKIRTVK